MIAIIGDFGLAKVHQQADKIGSQRFQEYHGLSIRYAPPEAFNRVRFKKTEDFSVSFVILTFNDSIFFFFFCFSFLNTLTNR